MFKIRLSILLLSLCLTASCGFRPVHAKLSNDLSLQLSTIQITDIAGRNGQILKYKLAELLMPDNTNPYPEYRLDISLKEEKRELGIQQDLRVTRYDIVQTADYKLINLANNQVANEGSVHIKSSYNRTDSEFSTFVAEEDASEKASEEIAQVIKQRLTAYFAH